MLRVLLSYLLITLFALGIGSLLSVRFSERVKRELLGYEPDAFRQLFLQRMDILDALDEGLMAIDEHSTITYMNRGFHHARRHRHSGRHRPAARRSRTLFFPRCTGG